MAGQDARPGPVLHHRDWLVVAGIAGLAALLRVVFFTGFFGSDDINAARSALDIVDGRWPVTEYVVSQRYGIFLPTALVIKILGFTELTATLWSWLCSVGEVVVVCAFACLAWGRTAGLTSGLLMATLPIHVHTGGQPTGDAPLAFFITLSMVLFYLGETRGRASWYVAAGLAAGATFWIKEVATIWIAAFLLYAVVRRTWNPRWLLVAAGFAVMVLASSMLFLVIAGDPLHYFKVILRRGQDGRTLWLYPYYLFLDLRHTWILGYLGLAALLAWRRPVSSGPPRDAATRYVLIWLGGILLVLTFLVVKVRPVTFISQQVNYMVMFLAPLILVAGLALARWPISWRTVVLGVWLAGAVPLAGLEQQAIRAFTANSRAAWDFAKSHPDSPVYGTVHAFQMAGVLPFMDAAAPARPRILPLSKLPGEAGESVPIYVILDLETLGWGDEPSVAPGELPACWERVTQLKPEGFGAGRAVAGTLKRTAAQLPEAIGRRLVGRFDRILTPRPAFVYRVPIGCPRDLPAGSSSPRPRVGRLVHVRLACRICVAEGRQAVMLNVPANSVPSGNGVALA